jgi:ABC-type multidrug transport system ATPase subunit
VSDPPPGDAASEAGRPYVRLRDVAVGYRGLRVLSGVDLAIRPGDLLVLLGADGSGKSTLLRLLAGLLRPQAGSVERTIDRTRLGYSGAEFDLYPDLTTEENLRFFAGLRGVEGPALDEVVGRLLLLTGLEEGRGRLAAQLSGGMKKKLSLASSMAHSPSLLLLDEPTVGVDAAARRELWDIVALANAEGAAVVYTSPYLDEEERARRVVYLVGGQARETTEQELFHGARGWQAWVTPVTDRREARRRLAMASLGPRAYLRQEGLTVLARDRDEAVALTAAALHSGDAGARAPEPERAPLTVEDAFVLLVSSEGARGSG